MKRSELLKVVETVKISVDKSGGQTGSDFLLFDNDWVRGFNDAISVSMPIPGLNIINAVKATELIEVLKKMSGENIRVAEEDGRVLIKDAKTTLRMTPLESEALSLLQENISSLNTHKIEWKPMPKKFMAGLNICLFSAGVTPNLGALSGIFFSEDNIMATDNHRITLFKTGGKVQEPFILPTEAANGIKNLGEELSGISITGAWVHFKGVEGLIVSVRRLLADYPFEKIEKVLEDSFPKGKKTKVYELPEGIEKSIDRVEVLAESGDEWLGGLTYITLKRSGKHLIIHGSNEAGEIEDKILWEDDFPEDVEIKVSPAFLKKIIEVTRTFLLSQSKTTILFEGESFKHLMVAKVEGNK